MNKKMNKWIEILNDNSRKHAGYDDFGQVIMYCADWAIREVVKISMQEYAEWLAKESWISAFKFMGINMTEPLEIGFNLLLKKIKDNGQES